MGVGSGARRMLGASRPRSSVTMNASCTKVLDIRTRQAYTHGNVRPSWCRSLPPPEEPTLTERHDPESVQRERRAQTIMMGLFITLSSFYATWLGTEVVGIIRDNQARSDQLSTISEKVQVGQQELNIGMSALGVRVDKLNFRVRRVEKNPTKKYDVDEDGPSGN